MGTDAWKNWRGFLADLPEREYVHEDLHSDRQFAAGPVILGPYKLSTVMRAGPPTSVQPVGSAVRLLLGVHANLVPEVVINGELASANSDSYHGGGIGDEVAALVSLTLGVRLRLAGTIQMSLIHQHGSPREPIHLEVTPLAHPGVMGKESIPAALSRPADLRLLQRLELFPRLNETAQIALVKAARAYATALWWANEDPNLAWLQLVTAVEIAASQRKGASADPIELVRSLWPELWQALEPASDVARERVCILLAPQIRATRKFIDFLVEYAPNPPPIRPLHGGLNWADMEGHARLIYGHRSKALHEGKPFPLPMLELPRIEENGASQEVPFGLNSGGLGGIWDAAEAPMLLSTFEFIARGALLRWWTKLAG